MPLRLLQNQQNQASWISNKVQLVKRQFMDGISLALDAVVANRSNDYFAMPKLVAKVKKVFQRSIPGSQVTFNVPWSPDCINGQCHDYSEIANSCDSLIVMSFDMQKQMWTDCRAKASAPFYQTISGISAYIKLGIDSRKIVMGVPWYGFNYPCKRFLEAGNCELIGRPYRGAPCSSKIARRLPYKDIMRQLSRSVSGKIWDDDVKAPYFVYKAGEKYHEVWYDDPESISMRATILKKLKLQGISIWFGNYLNYSTDPRVAMQTEEMWNALCPP
ncbi:di-N-acetylchitobiase-like [Pristis pectinata]|uniref:di-N-acetylchitobiase-like n=1 Tax=Pristis pectinata TaxID=685728 RepID=UPI00223E40A3|nr:di-N-acetylchitobiase-like [Pristis pectinata]